MNQAIRQLEPTDQSVDQLIWTAPDPAEMKALPLDTLTKISDMGQRTILTTTVLNKILGQVRKYTKTVPLLKASTLKGTST